MRTMNDDEDAD